MVHQIIKTYKGDECTEVYTYSEERLAGLIKNHFPSETDLIQVRNSLSSDKEIQLEEMMREYPIHTRRPITHGETTESSYIRRHVLSRYTDRFTTFTTLITPPLVIKPCPIPMTASGGCREYEYGIIPPVKTAEGYWNPTSAFLNRLHWQYPPDFGLTGSDCGIFEVLRDGSYNLTIPIPERSTTLLTLEQLEGKITSIEAISKLLSRRVEGLFCFHPSTTQHQRQTLGYTINTHTYGERRDHGFWQITYFMDLPRHYSVNQPNQPTIAGTNHLQNVTSDLTDLTSTENQHGSSTHTYQCKALTRSSQQKPHILKDTLRKFLYDPNLLKPSTFAMQLQYVPPIWKGGESESESQNPSGSESMENLTSTTLIPVTPAITPIPNSPLSIQDIDPNDDTFLLDSLWNSVLFDPLIGGKDDLDGSVESLAGDALYLYDLWDPLWSNDI